MREDVAVSSIIDELAWRGLIAQSTDLDALRAATEPGPITLYCGFDPTAPSLHLGNLVQILTVRRFQQHGHRPLALVGGATGLIGDPKESGERTLNPREVVEGWVARIRAQLDRFYDFEGPNAAIAVNNLDWTEGMGVLEFLRDVGKHFSVNRMLDREAVAARLAKDGISYTEFSYQLLQADDFRHLYQHHGVELQAGASDQWGNIVAGVELIRRRMSASAHAITHPLMTKSDGSKFGKSVGGAVWLDPRRTSPYQFRQFWVQSDDQMVGTYLKMLSLRPLADLDALLAEHAAAPERRIAQRALADEMTTMVHGADAAEHAAAAAAVLFGGDPTGASAATLSVLAAEVPSVHIDGDLDGRRVHELLVDAGVASSISEVGRLLAQGGVRAGNRVLDRDGLLQASDQLEGGFVLIRKGKRDFVLGISSPRG